MINGFNTLNVTYLQENCFLKNVVLTYQSINQSNFYSANIPGVARFSGATARSVFKCEVVEVVP